MRRERLWATVFGGSEECGPDRDSLRTWQELGMGDRVTLTETENWWSNGPVGLCGPDSEIVVRLLRRSLLVVGGDVGDLPVDLVGDTIDHFGPQTDGRTLQRELRTEQDPYRGSLRHGRREVEKLLRRAPSSG